MIHRFIAYSIKRPWRVISITALAAVLAASLSLGLRIDSNVLAMLPDDLPVAQNFAQAADEFGASNPIVIAVLPMDDHAISIEGRTGAIRLIKALEQELGQQHFGDGPLFSSVEGLRNKDIVEQQLATILPLTPRFMPADQLDNVLRRLQPALVKHRLDNGPPPNHPAQWHQRDPVGLWSSSYKGFWEEVAPKELRDHGILLSPDGSAYMLLAWPQLPPQNAPYSKAVNEAVSALISKLQPQANADNLIIDWAAGHRLAANDFQAAQDSAILMTAGSLIGIIVLFTVVFASLRLLLVVVCLLLPALAAGIGLGGWAVGGELSMVVVAFAAILAGLGVDLIIHAYAAWKRHFSALCGRLNASTPLRLRALRRRAIALAFPRVLPALAIATLTTSAAFVALYLGSFRGLQQLGLISAVGLVTLTMVIIASLPALLSIAAPLRIPTERGLGALAKIYRTNSRIPLTCCLVVICAIALWLAISDQPFPITEDSRDLRPRHDPVMTSQTQLLERLGFAGRHDSLYVQGSEGGPERGLIELVEQRQAAAQMVPELLHPSGQFFDLWADPQQQLASQERLQNEIDWEALAALAQDYPHYALFWRDLELLRNGATSTFELMQGSPWAAQLNRVVRSDDGASWSARLNLRLVDKAPIPAIAEGFDLPPQTGNKDQLSQSGLRQGLAGNQSLSHYLHQALAQEMKRLAWFAALATTIVFALGMRRMYLSLIGMGVLGISVLSTAAMVAGLGLSWNMITIAVLPLVVGIGIDDVVHFSHYLRSHPAASTETITEVCARACRHIGPPTLLTSLTTGIGFGSLLLSDYRGLQDMGLIAVIGIVSCLVCTVCSLPLIAWAANRTTSDNIR